MTVNYKDHAENMWTAEGASWVNRARTTGSPDGRVDLQSHMSGLLSMYEATKEPKWADRALQIAEACIASPQIVDSDGRNSCRGAWEQPPGGYTNLVGRTTTWSGRILSHNYESSCTVELSRLCRVVLENKSALNALVDRTVPVYRYVKDHHLNKVLDLRAYGRWYTGKVQAEPGARTEYFPHDVLQMARSTDDMARASIAAGLTDHIEPFTVDTTAPYNTWAKICDRIAGEFKKYLVHPREPGQWSGSDPRHKACVNLANDVDSLVWDCGMQGYPRNYVDFRTDDTAHADDIPWAVVSLYDQPDPKRFTLDHVQGLANTFKRLIYDNATPLSNPKFTNFVDGFNGEFRPGTGGQRAPHAQGMYYQPGWCALAWFDKRVWEVQDAHLAAMLAGTSTRIDNGRILALCGFLAKAQKIHTAPPVVTPPAPQPTNPRISADSNTYKSGDTITVTVHDPPTAGQPNMTQWVGLWRDDDPLDSTWSFDSQWAFVQTNSQDVPTEFPPNPAQVTLRAPDTIGQYKLVYWAVGGKTKLVQVITPIAVTEPQVDVPDPIPEPEPTPEPEPDVGGPPDVGQKIANALQAAAEAFRAKLDE